MIAPDHRRAGLQRFSRFLAVGVANTIVSYVIYLAAIPALGYRWAYVTAFIAGVTLSYVLSSRWVFRSERSVSRALAFPLVYAPQLLIDSLVLRFAVERVGIHPSLAILLVIGLTVPLNYLLAKLVLQRTSARTHR